MLKNTYIKADTSFWAAKLYGLRVVFNNNFL